MRLTAANLNVCRFEVESATKKATAAAATDAQLIAVKTAESVRACNSGSARTAAVLKDGSST
jgi:hypothetical protein